MEKARRANGRPWDQAELENDPMGKKVSRTSDNPTRPKPPPLEAENEPDLLHDARVEGRRLMREAGASPKVIDRCIPERRELTVEEATRVLRERLRDRAAGTMSIMKSDGTWVRPGPSVVARLTENDLRGQAHKKKRAAARRAQVDRNGADDLRKFLVKVWPTLSLIFGKPGWREEAAVLCGQFGLARSDRTLDRTLRAARKAGKIPDLRKRQGT